MKKIPTIFIRDDEGNITHEWDPYCTWVRDNEGHPTRKWDGTSCLLKGGKLYKRREVKKGKPIPSDFDQVDETDKKIIGWVPVDPSDPSDKWHMEGLADKWHMEGLAFLGGSTPVLADTTCELCGPKVQGNPEGLEEHVLIPHGEHHLEEWCIARSYENIRSWLSTRDIEGIVWYHPNGRMAKIKKRDFGLARKPLDPKEPPPDVFDPDHLHSS